jgi:hypothetical protein
VRTPVPADDMGPIVVPHGESFRTTTSWMGMLLRAASALSTFPVTAVVAYL